MQPGPGTATPAELLAAAQRAIQEDRLGDAAACSAALRTADPGSLNPVLLDGWIAFHGGDLDGAIGQFEQAYRRRPSSLVATIIATAHHGRHRLDQAEGWFREGRRINPADAETLRRYGRFLWETNRLDEAEAALTEAMALAPADQEVTSDMGYCRLKAGDYGRGWMLLDRRWFVPGSEVGIARRDGATLAGRVWFQEPLAGRRLLVLAEAGFGDVVQFARFVPRLVAAGADVLFHVRPDLLRLFQGQSGFGRVISGLAGVASIDLISPIMSLAGRLGVQPEDLPGAVGYLAADPALVAGWDRRLAALGPARRVGLAWSGRPHRAEFGLDTLNQRRAVPFAALAPLLAVPGCRFVSLQKGPTAGQAAQAPGILDWTAELADFADTAALIAALDLVITSDTSIAHLAGALGKPVWVLDRWDSCWRWLTGRTDSPWYPSLRIFRQAVAGDWSQPVAAAAAALAAVTRGETGR